MNRKPYEVVETYKNEPNNVIKYIHYNGSETTLKTVPSCVDNKNGIFVDKNKAVLFVSVSTGCAQQCKFCYLTGKKFPFCQLDTNIIVRSCIEVIKRSKKELKSKFLKISFMGMGDVFASNTDMNDIIKKVFLFAYNKGYIKGIDGVDIGTSYPAKNNVGVFKQINAIKETIFYLGIPFNPFYNYSEVSTDVLEERTPVRLFVSLHSIDPVTKQFLMPNSRGICEIIEDLDRFIEIDVIFHFILFADINDSDEDLEFLISFFSDEHTKKYELRLLRFNACPGIPLRESRVVDKYINELRKSSLKFKYQISAGSEISAACGQFLCRKIK